MSLRPGSSAYEDTPIVQTTERLPTIEDGPNVFAREHQSTRWWKVRWSEVTKSKHAEWRQLRMSEAHKKHAREQWRAAAERRLAKKAATP